LEYCGGVLGIDGMFLLRGEDLSVSASGDFCVLLSDFMYNAVSIVKAAISAAHGQEAVEEMSWYYADTETSQVWYGMEIALPFPFWAEKFDNRTDKQLAEYLKILSQKIDVNKFKKNKRGKRKKVIKKYDPKVKHLSTFQIINERKTKSP
jgi:hypothetical protein